MTTQINDSAKICTTNLVSDNINTTHVNIVETVDKFEVRQLSGDIQKLNTSNINATATKTFETTNPDLLFALNNQYAGVLDDIIGEASTRASVVPTISGHTNTIEGDEDSGDLTGTLTANKPVTWSIHRHGNRSESITITEQGNWTYTPKQDANGDDSFEVKATDSDSQFNIVTINITLIGKNDTPKTNDVTIPVIEDTLTSFNLPVVSDPDLTDTHTYIITQLPNSNFGKLSQGNSEITSLPHELSSRENLLFTPIENKNGLTTFKYKVKDQNDAESNESEVTLSISAVNDPPTASVAYSIEIDENGSRNINLPPVVDPDSDVNKAEYYIASLPTKGTLKKKAGDSSIAEDELVESDNFKYVGKLNEHGSDSFKYKIKDEHGAFSNEIQVDVTIKKYQDTTPPSKPTGLANTSTEIDLTPTITGTAEAGSTVKIFNGNTQIGSGVADENGSFTITSSTLAVGNHSLTATATDAANNTSGASDALSITIFPKMILKTHIHNSEYAEGYFSDNEPLKVYLSNNGGTSWQYQTNIATAYVPRNAGTLSTDLPFSDDWNKIKIHSEAGSGIATDGIWIENSNGETICNVWGYYKSSLLLGAPDNDDDDNMDAAYLQYNDLQKLWISGNADASKGANNSHIKAEYKPFYGVFIRDIYMYDSTAGIISIRTSTYPGQKQNDGASFSAYITNNRGSTWTKVGQIIGPGKKHVDKQDPWYRMKFKPLSGQNGVKIQADDTTVDHGVEIRSLGVKLNSSVNFKDVYNSDGDKDLTGAWIVGKETTSSRSWIQEIGGFGRWLEQ